MKKAVLKSIIIFSALLPALVLADGVETPKTRVGPGKAVLEATMENGLKLSEKAALNLELRFVQIRQSGAFTIPTSALVKFQDFYAIYRQRNGWLKMVEVEPQVANGTARVSSKEIRPGDEIVIENADLLRVVDLDIWGPEADACVD